ncbi:MAG: catechol 2,3-dioxygenase-like lactoylglutathione lyase family enzyme [Porticoccaceae bacterium]
MNSPLCKVADILFVRFEVTDLQAQKEFLQHFGMRLAKETADSIYFRGNGIAPFIYVASQGIANRYISSGYYVNAFSDLENLARDTGVEIIESQEPGGGQKVTLSDPDGMGVEVFFGVALDAAAASDAPPLNSGFDKSRVNELQRIGKGADEWVLENNDWRYALKSKVLRLGHIAVNVADPEASLKWYQNTLGYLISDNLGGPDGSRIGAFMRCDQGDAPVDHHAMNFIGAAPGKEEFAGTFGHAGYELTESVDDLMAGHFHLKTLGKYVHEWGIGRHLLGSQMYDYWRDPHGFTLEHWTDGDLLDASVPANDSPIRDTVMAQYGPLVPSSFGLSMPSDEVETYRADNPGFTDMVKLLER